MPTSKRRKPKHQHPGRPNTHRMLPAEARVAFRLIVQRKGTTYAADQATHAPTGPLTDVYATAHTYATTHGHRYVEGIATINGHTQPHAWALDTNDNVIETTDTTNDPITTYRGIVINDTEMPILLEASGRTYKRPLLEAGLTAGGSNWTETLERLKA